MRDYVGDLIAGAVQRRVQQAMGPSAAALAARQAKEPGRAAAMRLMALSLNIQLRQLTGSGQERRPGNGQILKRTC